MRVFVYEYLYDVAFNRGVRHERQRRKTKHKAMTAFDIISSEDVSELSHELELVRINLLMQYWKLSLNVKTEAKMNDDTLINLVARGLVDKIIHLFNKYLGTQLKIRNEKRVLPYISKSVLWKT
ncbi:hypothetical protein I6G24_10890 [Lactococcus lactis]|nr:hypothetical protein [Lactococcus lactis]UBU72963.1 hypothetical protein I6G24_10890 [Lactococcus lactis]